MQVSRTTQAVQKVAARHGRLPMRGVDQNTRIRIYSASGALVYSGLAAEIHHVYLPDGVYIIRIEE